MGRGVKSVSKKKPTDLCLLQLWSSSWSAQRRDGSTTPLFHEKSCGLVHSATNIMMFFMNLLYLQNRFFWAIFCFIFSFSISYSKPKQNNWDLAFSGLTSLFYYFFPPSPMWYDIIESPEILWTALWKIYIQFWDN